MPINIRCPNCNAPATLKDKYAGKKVCCPKCSSAFRVMIEESGPSARTPQPRIDPAARESLRQASMPPPPPLRRNGLEERCLLRKDSGMSWRLRWRRWSTSHAGLLGTTTFALGLLVGGGIMLAVTPSRDKADASSAQATPTPVLVQAEPSGQINLLAAVAEAHGTKAKYELADDRDNIGFWTDMNDYVTWIFEAPVTGSYQVEITYACDNPDAGSAYCIGIGRSQLTGTVPATGGWGKFRTDAVGELHLARGKHTLTVWATAMPKGAVMNLQRVRLVPTS